MNRITEILNGHTNKREESRDLGAIYYLLKLDHQNDNNNLVVLRHVIGPTKHQGERIFVSADERSSRKQLVEFFWRYYGRNRTAVVSVGNNEKLYVQEFVSINEARVLVFAFCSRGYRRKERIRAINSYSKLLLREFPQTNASEHWRFYEVSREILEMKLLVDLSDPDSWQHIRQWFSQMDKRISAHSGYPLRYVRSRR